MRSLEEERARAADALAAAFESCDEAKIQKAQERWDVLQESSAVVFDPRFHPRNRMGQFRNSLLSLGKGGVNEMDLPGGMSVKKAIGGGYKLRDRKGKSLGRHLSADALIRRVEAEGVNLHSDRPQSALTTERVKVFDPARVHALRSEGIQRPMFTENPHAEELESLRRRYASDPTEENKQALLAMHAKSAAWTPTEIPMGGSLQYAEHLQGIRTSSLLSNWVTNHVNLKAEMDRDSTQRKIDQEQVELEMQRRRIDPKLWRLMQPEEREKRIRRLFEQEKRDEGIKQGMALKAGDAVKVDSLDSGIWQGRVVKANKDTVDVEVERPTGGTYTARFRRDSMMDAKFSASVGMSIPKRSRSGY